ncbi:MAG TPA: hypothetical protein VE057_07545 [Archangium sp.]|nr:hypothetical protein [Archangium sp.]
MVFGTGPGTVTEGSDVRLPPAPGAAGQLLYSNGSSWSALPPGGPAQVLHGGETPAWGPVSLGGDVSGVLPVGNGGTGLDSPGAAGNVLRSTGSGWTSSPLTGGDVPAGSGHYIQNQHGAPQNAQLWINGRASVGALQVGGGTPLRQVQMGTRVLNPPRKCTNSWRETEPEASMNPRRPVWMLACVALLAVGGLLGVHVYRLETRLASLEANAGRPEARAPSPGAPTVPAASAPPTPVMSTRRSFRLDERVARQAAQRLGSELGLEQERVEKLARFLMAFHLRAALASARAEGEDVSGPEESYPELLRGDLKQELRGLRLSQAQLTALSRETPGLEALLSP